MAAVAPQMTTATTPQEQKVGFGIDIGGTGIKGALVDVDTGDLLTARLRLPTPHPATPEDVANVVADIVLRNRYTDTVGITFPAVIQQGVAKTAANVDKSWIGMDVATLMAQYLPGGAVVLNDADAAGLAEMRFGAGKGVSGVVLVLTLGTGIGSALFINGQLVPNTEFGHVQMKGDSAERYAAASVKETHNMTYAKWAKRVSAYLQVLERFIYPDLIILGGGVSKKADKWIPLLESRTPIVPAVLKNNAGIVGAAMAAYEHHGE